MDEVEEVETSEPMQQVVVLTEEQYNALLDSISSVTSSSDLVLEGVTDLNDSVVIIGDSVDSIDGKLNTTNTLLSDLKNSVSTSSDVQVPEDYFTTMADLQSQNTFFLSLLFGAFICYIFVSQLK